MSQHDYHAANQPLNIARTDVNNALASILSNNSGSSAPTTTDAYMVWADTSNSVFKQRNSADNGWITRFKLDGVQQYASGSTAALPAFSKADDVNTGIYFPAADTVAISVGGSEAVRVDSDGNVGIGTTDPDTRLHIKNNSFGAVVESITLENNEGSTNEGSAIRFLCGSATNGVTLVGKRDGSGGGAFIFKTSSTYSASPTEKMRIASAGNVGIGTSPVHRLHVDNSSLNSGNVGTVCKITGSGTSASSVTVLNVQNSFYVDGAGKVFMPSLGTSGSGNPVHITSSGELWENGSSKRFKTNIENLKSIDSSLIYKLKPVEYDRVNEEGEAIPGTHEIGFIAEEVEKILPIIVNYDQKEKESDPNIPRGVDKSILIPLIIKELQVLRETVNSLELSAG